MIIALTFIVGMGAVAVYRHVTNLSHPISSTVERDVSLSEIDITPPAKQFVNFGRKPSRSKCSARDKPIELEKEDANLKSIEILK